MTLLKEFAGKAAAEHLMVMCMMRNKVELVPELMMAQLLPDIDLLTAAGEWHAVGAAGPDRVADHVPGDWLPPTWELDLDHFGVEIR